MLCILGKTLTQIGWIANYSLGQYYNTLCQMCLDLRYMSGTDPKMVIYQPTHVVTVVRYSLVPWEQEFWVVIYSYLDTTPCREPRKYKIPHIHLPVNPTLPNCFVTQVMRKFFLTLSVSSRFFQPTEFRNRPYPSVEQNDTSFGPYGQLLSFGTNGVDFSFTDDRNG